jgi:hypothetical protein
MELTMKNNNISKPFLLIASWLFICLPATVLAMNQITLQDLTQLGSQEISRERFNELKNIPDVGNNWLSTSYEHYLELTDWALEHFVQVAQQNFDTHNPPITQPASPATTSNSNPPVPVEKITGVKQFVGSFFETLLPWNATNTQTAAVQDGEIKDEIKHDPLKTTQYSLDIPGMLQTIKNKIIHHNTGVNVVSYALPAASTVVDHVGHHIEQNPLLYYSGGDTTAIMGTAETPAVLANTANTSSAPVNASTAPPTSTDAVDWPAWTGWLMKKTAQTGLAVAKNKQVGSEIIAGKPAVDPDESYATIRSEHKTKLRTQFKGTDEEFEEFFANHPTPVQGTALYNKNYLGSLVDGMVAGLNDASKYSAYQAELLNNPTVRNAHATIRRINKTYVSPKSFKDALVILRAIDEICANSITPEELFDVENNPDPYLVHLQCICQDIHSVLTEENIEEVLSIGHIKDYTHRCKIILEALKSYSNYDTRESKALAQELDMLIRSINNCNNSILIDTLPKCRNYNIYMQEAMQNLVGAIVNQIELAQEARTHLFADSIAVVCNHIHQVQITHHAQQLSDDNKRLYENYITYDDHSYFEKLWANLFRRNITNSQLTEFLQNKVLCSLPVENFFITKINLVQHCNLFGYNINADLQGLIHIPGINEPLVNSLHACCKIIKNDYAGFNSRNDATVQALAAAIADLEMYEYTHHTDVSARELYNYRLGYDLSDQLNNDTHREQALQDLIGYYLILLKPLVTDDIGDYLISLKNAQPTFSEEIPTPPAPPVLKDPKYVRSFKKKRAGLIDQALDKVADTVTNGAEYLVENGPEIAENIGARLNKADREAHRARHSGNNAAVAWVQGALAAPDPLPIPAPPAQALPIPAPAVAGHDYDIKPEIQAWRINHGKNPEEPASSVAHPWHGRQETYNDNASTLAQALKNKINIENDHKTNNVVREEQFKYALNQPAQIVHPKPSYISKFQDTYIAATIRLGYAGDILLLTGLSYVLYKTCSGLSFSQIRQLETVEKQCKYGMRNLEVGRATFDLPTLAITSLAGLDEAQRATLQQAIAQASDALEKAQAALQQLPELPANPQDLEVIKTADKAVNDVIVLIKQYKKHIIQKRSYFDMILSNSTKGLVGFMKMMTA